MIGHSSWVPVVDTGVMDDEATERVVGRAVRAAMPWPDRLMWAAHQPPPSGEPGEDALAPWREAVDPGGTGQFDQRLALAGLSREQAIVAMDANVLPQSDIEPIWPAYLRPFLRAVRDCDPADGDDAHWLVTRETGLPAAAGHIPFAPLLWPGVRASWRHLAHAHPDVAGGLNSDVVVALQVALLARLAELAAPTLAESAGAARTVGQRFLAQVLDEPRDALRAEFARACRALAAGGLGDALCDHPVLPALIGTAIRQWRESTVEMLQRIDRHRDDLTVHLGIDPHADLTGLSVGAGDRHHDGRAVAILAFGGGQVVYKPRDTRLEQLWADVVTIVNTHLPDEGLRAPRTVLGSDAQGHFGFAEFIEHVPCADGPTLDRFYANAGRTLALLLALSATDCHLENLIAHGDQLILIDAEALFETRGAVLSGPDVVSRDIAEPGNVLQTGMLPSWTWLEGRRMAVDISALGCAPDFIGQRPKQPRCLPTPPGQLPDLTAHVDDVVRGFTQGYRALMMAREAGILERLAMAGSLSRRLIQRPTYIYSVLLAQAREPAALRDPVAQGMVLERLTRAYLTSDAERAWPLLVAELRAMARMDVPLFEAALDGTRIWSRGVDLPDLPGDDALARVIDRIVALAERDLQWQTHLIRASIAARVVRANRWEDSHARVPIGSGGTASSVVAMAERCAHEVETHAMSSAGRITWMTVGVLPDGEHVKVQPVGSGLYDGATGIALALHLVGRRAMAQEAIAQVFDVLAAGDRAAVRRQLLAVGPGLAGAGGYLRALRSLGSSGHLDGDLVGRAMTTIVASLPAPETDRNLDRLLGIAGVMAPLTAELREAGLPDSTREQIGQYLRAGADHLIARQRADGGWTTLPGSGPLTGLAHGAAGIALALVEAGCVVGDERCIDAAMRGIAFENGHLDVDAGNWPDLRVGTAGGFMLGWCAGAPGIGLSRMRLLELLPDHPEAARWCEDIDVAASTTANAPLLARDHLCCGNLGRAVVLRVLASTFDRSEWSDAADRLVGQVLARAGDGLPVSYLGPDAVLAVPGLFTGLAGMAAALDPGAPADWPTRVLL